METEQVRMCNRGYQIEEGDLLCTEHCCIWSSQEASVSGSRAKQRQHLVVPDENLAQSPVGFAILEFLSVGQLERGQRDVQTVVMKRSGGFSRPEGSCSHPCSRGTPCTRAPTLDEQTQASRSALVRKALD